MTFATGPTAEMAARLQQPCLICGRSPQILIICVLFKAAHLDARSATSSQCRSVEGIIETFTAVVMRQRGSKGSGSILAKPLVPCGSKPILWRDDTLAHPVPGTVRTI